MRVLSFDHVALWLTDPPAVAGALAALCPGLREIERTDAFTLVGADPREGKVTLFAAAGPREPGVLEALVLRVPDPDRAAATAERLGLLRHGTLVELPEGLTLRLTPGDPVDLEGVVLTVADPVAATEALLRLGFREDGVALALGGRTVTFREGRVERADRPLLNHLALRVESLDEAQAEALMLGFAVAREVDAANTRAAFLVGPEGIEIELVEHKPSFSLV